LGIHSPTNTDANTQIDPDTDADTQPHSFPDGDPVSYGSYS
jgi:hypothetical protein